MKKFLLILTCLLGTVGSVFAQEKWVKTDITAIQDGDIVAIVDQTSGLAISNDMGTSAASSSPSVTFNNEEKSELSGIVPVNIQFVFSIVDDGYKFYTSREKNKWLYCISNNNGIRTGTSKTGNVFDWQTNNSGKGYLHTKDSGDKDRYLGVYENTNWRSYNSTGTNITNTVTAFYVYSDPTAVSIATPQFSVASGIVDAGTMVEVTCDTEGVDVYVATAKELGSEEATDENVVMAGNKYTSALTINATETYYAVAVDDDDNFSPVAVATYAVPAHAGTVEDPYNVADAIAVATAVGTTETTETYYIQGYVVESEYFSSFKNATWKIADTAGATESLFTVFRCKDVNGAELEDENKVVVGDKIVVKGNIFNYNNNTPEAKNAELVSVTGLQPAELSWSVETFSYDKANPSDLPTLKNTNNVAVTYSSSDQTVATIDEEGEVTVLEVGTTTIKAAFAGNNEYKANTASYVLTVIDSANFEDITDVINQDDVKGTYNDYTKTCTESGITYIIHGLKQNSIQFNNNKTANGACGIVVTTNTNGYVLKSVKFNFGSTVSNEDLVLYGKETAYEGTSEVCGATPGTEIESFKATANESHTVTPSKEWQYVGFYPGGKNIQFSSIEFTWTLSSGLPQSDTFTFHNENLTTEHDANHVALDSEGNWAANAIVLTDDSGLDMPEGIEVNTPSAKYTRDFPHNGWQSICLPFSGNASDFVDGDHKIAELTGVTYDETEDAYTLEWTTVSTIVAHKAYIIKPVADGEQHVGHNTSTTTISGYNQHDGTEANGYTFKLVGTYKNIAFGSYSPEQRALMYVMNQGNFYHPGANATLKPFRAYLVMEPVVSSSTSMPAMLRMSVNGEEPGTTGINDIEIDLNLGVANADNCYYDLLGRKVENPAAGVYIQNGKKVYIK